MNDRGEPSRSSPSLPQHHRLRDRVLKLEEFRRAHEKEHETEHKAHEKEHGDHTATKAWVYKKGYVVVGLVATVGAVLVAGILRLLFG